jgi:hypothetical protein
MSISHDPPTTRARRDMHWRGEVNREQPKRVADERITNFHEIYSLHERRSATGRVASSAPRPRASRSCPRAQSHSGMSALAAEAGLEAAGISRLTSSIPGNLPAHPPAERCYCGALRHHARKNRSASDVEKNSSADTRFGMAGPRRLPAPPLTGSAWRWSAQGPGQDGMRGRARNLDMR